MLNLRTRSISFSSFWRESLNRIFLRSLATKDDDIVGEVKKARHKPVELAYEIIDEPGTGDKHPIVVLHGLFGSKQNWRSVAKKMCHLTQRKIILTDARNHGSSPHSPEMNYDCMVEDISCLLDKLQLRKVCVLGHSMGGKTAMLTAFAYPWRVKELIVVDVAPKYSLSGGDLKIFLDAMMGIDLDTLKTKEEADLYLREAVKSKTVRRFILTNLLYSRKTKKYYWRLNLDAIYKNFHRILDFPNVQTPYEGRTAFITGLNSTHVVDEDYEKIDVLFPQIYIERLQFAGHWVHADQPVAFVKVVDMFVNQRYFETGFKKEF